MSHTFHCRCGRSFRLKSREGRKSVRCPACGREMKTKGSAKSRAKQPVWDQAADQTDPALPRSRQRKHRKHRKDETNPELAVQSKLTRDDRHFLLTISLAIAMGINGLLALDAIGRIPFLLNVLYQMDSAVYEVPPIYDVMFQTKGEPATKETLLSVLAMLVAVGLLRLTLALSWMALYFFWRPGLAGAIVSTTLVALLEGFLGDGSFALNSILVCGGIVLMMFYMKPVTWPLYRSWSPIVRPHDP